MNLVTTTLLFASVLAVTWTDTVDKIQSWLSEKMHDFNVIQDPSQVLGSGEKKLSDINILLPLQTCKDCRQAHKLVTAINGCYEWKVSHPKLIEMHEFASKSHPECTNVVEISSKIEKETSNIIWLTAKDKSSSQVLTAQIKVAKIARLEIHSRMRQVAKNDKVHLEARAIDSEGNSISSLDGLQFDW